MNLTNLGKNSTSKYSTGRELLNTLKDQLIDPLATELANKTEWKYLNNVSNKDDELYPITITGTGEPVILLHGFDSSFLEFRRLAPLLKPFRKLIIPDLFGFGFCPRPKKAIYGPEAIFNHLGSLLEDSIITPSTVGVIGASMGGAVAMELARRYPKKVKRVMLLSPAGLTGKAFPIPHPLDKLGVCFLSQKPVRKAICRQAFADPNKSVGLAEEQIASLHLGIEGWGRSLAGFARSGGLANYGNPLPKQPLNVIWGAQDRILKGVQKEAAISLLKDHFEQLENCGHLPHLDRPDFVASQWLKNTD